MNHNKTKTSVIRAKPFSLIASVFVINVGWLMTTTVFTTATASPYATQTEFTILQTQVQTNTDNISTNTGNISTLQSQVQTNTANNYHTF